MFDIIEKFKLKLNVRKICETYRLEKLKFYPKLRRAYLFFSEIIAQRNIYNYFNFFIQLLVDNWYINVRQNFQFEKRYEFLKRKQTTGCTASLQNVNIMCD